MFSFLKKNALGILSRQEFPFYRKFPPKLCLNIQDKATIISHHFQFSYTRISKAANSTIVASLYNAEKSKVVDTLPEVQQIKDNYYNRLSSLNKEQVRLLMDNYYKITFVRNPSIRILSAYLDKVVQNKGGKGDFVAQFLEKPIGSNISLDEFLSYLELGGVNQNAHWARQIDMLPFPPNKFDYIGKCENLFNELPYTLTKIFKKSCKIISVREHATNALAISENLDQVTLRRIHKIYEADFEYFKYSNTK